MNTMKKTGLTLIIIGLALTLFTAFTFFTREKVVDIGSLKITANKPHHVSWSPIVGIIVLAAGGIIFFIPQKK
jgi:divalent metal cation (Fe/Co/Zn/Cd) transporter